MDTNSLSAFIAKIESKGRISFGDVQRIKRDILPDGLASRRDADCLLDLDRRVPKSDASWSQWLTMIRRFCGLGRAADRPR